MLRVTFSAPILFLLCCLLQNRHPPRRLPRASQPSTTNKHHHQACSECTLSIYLLQRDACIVQHVEARIRIWHSWYVDKLRRVDDIESRKEAAKVASVAKRNSTGLHICIRICIIKGFQSAIVIDVGFQNQFEFCVFARNLLERLHLLKTKTWRN